MKKQKMLFGIIAMFVCLLLLISGCTQQKTPTTTSIQGILAKAKNIGPARYLAVTTYFVNGTLTMNETKSIIEKSPYMKVKMSDGISSLIMIKRPDGVYVYNSESNNYTKIDTSFSEPSLEELSNAFLLNISFRVVGNETINGNATTIIQYTTNESGILGTAQIWIWNEKGIPIKSQITVLMGKTTLTTKTEYVNFVFGDIPLSEFSVS